MEASPQEAELIFLPQRDQPRQMFSFQQYNVGENEGASAPKWAAECPHLLNPYTPVIREGSNSR